MTIFLLMRHAEPDYSGPKKWNTPGWGNDLAPLTSDGEKQALEQVEKILEFDPEIVLSSPTTRTLQTALNLRPKLSVPFKVEFELHEWVPDLTFQWRTSLDVKNLADDYERHNGEWPSGETRPWEPRAGVKSRVLTVLQQYTSYQRVLVVCHADVIKSVTGTSVGFAALAPFELHGG